MTGAPLHIAQISDPHFGTEVQAVRDALQAELLEARPDLLIVTGDITQRARRAQFAAARDFLRALPMPRVCLPGNHDLPLFDLFTRVMRPYARYRHFISPELAPQYIDPRVAVVCVDATSPRRHKDGAVDAPTVARVAAQLRALPQPFRIVATHQPLASATRSDRRNVIHGADHAVEQWVAAGADLFIGGHIHLPYCLEVGTADGRRAAVLAQAGTAISHRTREGVPNSYNRFELHCLEGGARRLCVARHDFDAGSGRFRLRRLVEARSGANAPGERPAGWKIHREENA